MSLQKKYALFILFVFAGSYFIFSFFIDPMHSLTEGPEDIFYSLVYARELAQGNIFSWNGLYPSTGFHPLWLLFMAVPYFFTQNLNIIVPILNIFLFFLFVTALRKFINLINLYKSKTIRILGLFLFSLVSASCYFWYMETALSVTLFLSYCAVAFTYKELNYSTIIALGSLGGLLVLARMDAILLIAPIHAFLILFSIDDKKWSKALIMILIPILTVGTYMLFLYNITGTPMPLSGSVKSTFPYFFQGTRWDIVLFKIRHGFFPIFVSSIALIGSWTISYFKKVNYFDKKNNLLIFLLVTGAIINVFYHLSFTRSGEIGSWYFAIHYYIAVLSIMNGISWLASLQKIKIKLFISFDKIKFLFFIPISLVLIFCESFLGRFNHKYKTSQAYGYKQYAEYLEKYNFDTRNRIYDSSDGSFAYFSKIPTFHRKGMAATPNYVKLQKKFISKNGTFLFGKDLNDYFKETNMDYILKYDTVKISSDAEECILKHGKLIMGYGKTQNQKKYFYLIPAKKYMNITCSDP